MAQLISVSAQWNLLDAAAKANLTEQGYRRYEERRDRLRFSGQVSWPEAEIILTGFIWDESEGECDVDES